jgi:P-type Cu2+ transporter
MAQALRPNLKLVPDAIDPRSALKSGELAQAKTLRTLTLVVENMRCGNCMRKVESALLAVPGVVGARTNLSTGRVAVVSNVPSHATLEPLIEAARIAGYKAHELPADDASAKSDDSDLVRRLAVAGFASTNIMMLSVAVWSGHGGDMAASLQAMLHWLSALIAVPAVAYAGMPFFASAAAALKARRINMDVPISLGVLLATAMSLYQTMRGSEQVYFDAAVSLLFFLLIGRVLDQRMRRQATGAAENLLGLLSPATTLRHADGTIERIATRTVIPGMALIIAAGERVPVDARITLGTASMDESLMTGETRPRKVITGETLYAGTVNLSGPIEAVAIACEENTLLAEITRLMQTAEQARGRYVRLADRAARLYAPAVHILGLATFLGWLWAGYGWEPALTAAIAVLIITCPCALALAVPAVQVAAIGRLFQHGIVVKAPDGLERLAEVDTIVLDKTGTLTLGELQLVATSAIDDAALSKAASLAVVSRHPYSRAIVRAARDRGLPILSASDVVEVAGAGLQAVVGGHVIKLGSAAFCGLGNGDAGGPGLWLRDGAATPVAFLFDDPLRPDAADVVAKLAKLGYHIELLSGDQTTVVAAAAHASGIVNWRAEVRPDDKAHHIDVLSAKGRKVLMVGDGLNDAPALASGHASIAPSSAADISQTASDAIFQGDKLAPLIEILAVAKAARSAALANFAIAIGYNVLFVPLAIIGVVTPLVAAIAMSVSSVTVTANAIWLGHKRLRDIQ